MGPTLIKGIAEKYSLRLYQPAGINTAESVNFLEKFQPDLFVVIAYGQILSQEILDVPRLFAVNLHASLLPGYRGAAPINWAVIRGEQVTGITVIKMAREMDAGPIIFKKDITIEREDTALTLEDKLSKLAAGVLLPVLEDIENNRYILAPQENQKATFAPKIKKEDGEIDWNNSAQAISGLIRGCLGWPGAFTCFKGELLKIHKAKVMPSPDAASGLEPGQIIRLDKEGIPVATKSGVLLIEELQIEGKRAMGAWEFICGHKIFPGDKFGKK